jgi:hypothetical protein
MMPAPFYCSPGIKGNHDVCLNKEGLVYYIKQFNRHHSSDPITTNLYEDERVLISAIRKKLSKVCKNKGDWCWVDQDFARDDPVIQSYYKPRIPKTRNQWLTTSDIDSVVRPYEKLFPPFRYLGAVPLDFDKLKGYRLSSENYCLHYNQDGKTKIGAVFNLDTHDKRGSHWVSMFCDLNKHYIAFFDSVGVKNPPKEIKTLMENIKRQIEQCQDHRFKRYVANRRIEFKVNHKNIQKGNSECGVFCIYFILKCLLGDHPDKIFNDPYLSDKTVNYFRAKVFRPSLHSDNSIFSEQGYQLGPYQESHR